MASEVGDSMPTSLTAAERQAVARMLTPFELVFTGWSVKRQLSAGQKPCRESARYGPAALAKLSAARGLGVYMLPVGLGMVAFGVAGHADIAVPLFVVMLVFLGLDLWRCALAARLGRAWRTSDGDRSAG